MDALRQKWLDTVVHWRLHPDAPANHRYWAPELETCSRERLKDIQNEKLAVLIPYLLAYSPFYRNKLQQAKLTARDIRSVDLRFVIGDFGQFTTVPCACGRTHVRAPGGFKGRADDLLNVHGVTVFPLAIEEVVSSMDTLGDEFAVLLTNDTGLDELTLQVETPQGLTALEREVLEDELVQRLRAVLEIRPRVEMLPPGTLPRPEFKASRIRDQRREL
jgi:phenylacetate-coenzyme A ligase PaaK-like adenylate-forming protein